MLINMSEVFSPLAFITTVSSLVNCVNSMVYIRLFFIAIAARFLPAPDVNAVQDLGITTTILLMLYSSCINTMSVPSSFIIFLRLSVAVLEW